MSRKPISKRRRFEVFKRDNFMCQYCGSAPPNILLEVDHIVPVCQGGEDDEANLITACIDCNRGKAGVSLQVVPKSIPEKASEILEREEQLAGYRAVIQSMNDRIERDVWDVAETLIPGSIGTGMRKDWIQSIKTFNGRLPLHEVIEAAEIAIAKKPSEYARFKYFCGICWVKIKEAGQ